MKTLEDVTQFLKDAQTYYLATADGDQPHVRPFGTAHIYKDRLYIQTGKKKDVAHQLDANGKAEICAMNKGKWLRICGTLVADDTFEAKKSMLDAYPSLRKMYAENDGNTIVYYFEKGTATLYSFTDAPEVVEL
ncbi:MAG: pyridoxamine 5'-phosphate oxidase family protein [Eubacterium sp.]|nr:pyridoxamine 5'-phosphate oxidase family protein [Eubacterium sp.]